MTYTYIKVVMGSGAGFLLICGDGDVLIGYTPKLGYWSGFGGKAEAGETMWQTAMRETYEELFGCYEVPLSAWELIPERAPMSDDNEYSVYRVHIDEILSALPEASPYYSAGVPSTLSGLINERITNDSTEITRIRIWNLSNDGFNDISDDLKIDLLAELQLKVT